MEFVHVCYRVSDLERSLAFYRLLGFEERRRFDVRDDGFVRALNLPGPSAGAFIGLPGDADRFELVQTPGVAAEAGAGYNHAGVRVEQMDALLERLAGQGVTPLAPPYQLPGGTRICLVPDPDGYPIELIQPA